MSKATLFFLLLALFCIRIPFAMGETLRVSPEGMSLTEALALAKDGDTVELAEGTYAEPEETFPLTVSHRVTICAAAGAQAVIDAPAFVAALQIKADGVTLRDLTINMRRTGVRVSGNDFSMCNCAVILADDSWRTSSCGVWLGGVYRASFTECSFTGCGLAMAGPPVSDASKEKPMLTGLFEVGDDPAYFTSHTVKDCMLSIIW